MDEIAFWLIRRIRLIDISQTGGEIKNEFGTFGILYAWLPDKYIQVGGNSL